MAAKEHNNCDTSCGGTADDACSCAAQKRSGGLWILFLAFFVFIAVVFLTQRKETIDWVEDYQAAVKLAKQHNKPLLLAFYKQFTPMSTSMLQNTYNNPKVKKYVEANFIPVLIDVDKHPDIARRYNVDYYPTHYIKPPDSDRLFGPRQGYDSPSLFIEELGRLLGQMKSSGK